MTQSFYDQYSELINILDCIVDVPANSSEKQKAEYLDLFQIHTKKALAKLDKNDESILKNDQNGAAVQARD